MYLWLYIEMPLGKVHNWQYVEGYKTLKNSSWSLMILNFRCTFMLLFGRWALAPTKRVWYCFGFALATSNTHSEGFDRSKVALESRFLNLGGTEFRNPVHVKKLPLSISEVILLKEIKLFTSKVKIAYTEDTCSKTLSIINRFVIH